ncbi:MAG: hypothetical protein HYV02_05455 [Deltaproteobacteria bacterium]|nr:hypothetical protein [Deltaproteobacteria bacterium]
MKQIVRAHFLICSLMVLGMGRLADAKPTLNLWTSIESQVRGTQAGSREAPLELFQRVHATQLPGDGILDTYVQYERLIGPDTQDGNLYVAQYEAAHITKGFGMTLGRQVLARSTYEGLMDGATFRLMPSGGRWSFDLFGGVSRSAELGDFEGTHGLLTGATGRWTPGLSTAFSLTTLYRRDLLKNSAWKTNGTLLVALAGSQKIGTHRDAQIYLDATYDVAGKTVPVATLGMQWRPSGVFAVNLSGSRYDANRQRTQATIFSLFADDDMWQGRLGIEYTIAQAVTVFTNYDFQRMAVGGATQYGHVAEVGVECSLRKLPVDGTLLYRFIDSFGGRANDVMLALQVAPWDFLAFDALTNVTQYTKITNNNDTAIATALGATLFPTKAVALRVGGEYLRNDHFNREWRFAGNLTVNWDAVQ